MQDNARVVVGDPAARVRGLARVLDTAIRVPGTSIRFGLDSIIGLVPGVGDLTSAALSGYIVLAAARLGVPAPVLTRMILNLATDTLVGAIPLLGDLFDVGFKANMRNAKLLDDHLGVSGVGAVPVPVRKASRGAIAAVIGAVVLMAAGAVLLAVVVFRALGALLG